MGALSDLYEVARDYGLGMRYFALSAGIVAALMVLLFLWGREDGSAPDAKPVAPVATRAAPGGDI